MPFSLSSKSKANREGIDPRLIEIDDLAITLTLVDYGHGSDSGLRTAEQQNILHLSGSSPNCDGYEVKSNHQSGRALDFYAYVNGRASWRHPHLMAVACAYYQAASILGYKIESGVLWKSRTPSVIDGIPYGWDCPHIQIED